MVKSLADAVAWRRKQMEREIRSLEEYGKEAVALFAKDEWTVAEEIRADELDVLLASFGVDVRKFR